MKFFFKNPHNIIKKELKKGRKLLKNTNDLVCICGSSRITSSDYNYNFAEEIGYHLIQQGYNILTAGGPGIMKAASKGASKSGKSSYGIGLYLQKKCNYFIDEKKYISVSNEARKILMAKYSKNFIFFPGGIGTFDELFHLLALVQAEEKPPLPIVLINSSFWTPFIKWIQEHLTEKNLVDPNHLSFLKICNSSDEVLEAFSNFETMSLDQANYQQNQCHIY